MDIIELKNKVIEGGQISRDEALYLYSESLEILCESADEIRKHYCSNKFDICTIINGKSGSCSEDCKFCAQSAHYNTSSSVYPLLSPDTIIKQAKKDYESGILRYSIVTSGKNLSDKEVDIMCDTIKRIIKEVGISVCISFGLLTENQFKKLKNAGVTRIHNNLETSRNFFPNICTTHSFDDKINAIKAAQAVGLSVCSGGIMGLGETPSDRIDMALTLRDLNVKSVPVNVLNPISGTPLEHNQALNDEDVRRIVAVYRFILPDASIRLAGGRELLSDKGRSCFTSGANSAISGDMLTTAGITTETDMKLIKDLGYETELCNG